MMDASLSIKNKFPPEDQPFVGYLGLLTLSLVQAFFKTGYYKPGQQGAKAALERLYQEWINLTQNQRELSFMIDDSAGEKGVCVYGFLSDVTPVKTLFSPDMAEQFVPKFRDYFDRRRMISFTIKPQITFEEFDGFVEIMSAPPENQDMQQVISAMTEFFVNRRIVNISVVYAEERVKGTALDPMVTIILSRLNKDLRVLPLYTHLTSEQKVEIKRRIFKDLLLPLKKTAVIKEILVYPYAGSEQTAPVGRCGTTDIGATTATNDRDAGCGSRGPGVAVATPPTGGSETTEHVVFGNTTNVGVSTATSDRDAGCGSRGPGVAGDTLDMEAELSRTLTPTQHLSVIRECAREWASLRPRADSEQAPGDQARYQRLGFILQKMAADLSFDLLQGESEKEGLPLMETLVENRTLSFEALPEKWQHALTIKKKVDDYLQNPNTVLEKLKAGWTDAVCDPIQMLSLLLDRNAFQPFADLFRGLARAWETSFGSINDAFYSAVEVGMAELGILAQLQDRQSPHRKELLEMMVRIKYPPLSKLIPLCIHEDIWLRKNICRVLAECGETVICDLIGWAKDPACHWQGVRNVVMILGDMGISNDAVLRFLDRCRSHSRKSVREEVMASYGKIKGEIPKKRLLEELTPKDPEKGVASHAVLALGNFQPVPEPFLIFLKEAVRKKRKDEKETDEKIAINSCLAIAAIAAFDFKTAQSFEPILIHAITPEKSSLFRPTGKYHEKEYAVRKAICSLLGVIGTKESLPLLMELLKEKPWLPEDKVRIKQAISHIEQRLDSGHECTGPD